MVTGPVLKNGLKKQGSNEVSIPEQFYKIILDVTGSEQRAIAFLMPMIIAHIRFRAMLPALMRLKI